MTRREFDDQVARDLATIRRCLRAADICGWIAVACVFIASGLMLTAALLR